MIRIYGVYFQNHLVYVGQTTKSVSSRFADHKATAKTGKGGSPKLRNKIAKHGAENFEAVLLNEFTDTNQADQMEIRLIAEHDLISNGCNIAVGGKVNRGIKKTAEQKRALSKRSKKQYVNSNSGLAAWNGSQRQKDFMTGRKHGIRSDQHNQAISLSKSHGTYKITMDKHVFFTHSINNFCKQYCLNSASLRNSLWEQRPVTTKGHIITVSKSWV